MIADGRDRRAPAGAHAGGMPRDAARAAPCDRGRRPRGDRAQLRPARRRARRGRALCAVVKANGYGHGAVECARGGARRRGDLARRRDGGRGRRAARRAAGRAPAGDGRAHARPSSTTALDADADVAVWRAGFARADRRARPRARRPAAAARQVRHRHGPARRARPATRVLALVDEVGGRRAARAGRVLDPLRDRRRAGIGLLRRAARAFARLAERDRARDHPGCCCHAANSAATLREPGSHFDMVRCGIAIYGLDPFQEATRAAAARAGAGAALVRRRREAL